MSRRPSVGSVLVAVISCVVAALAYLVAPEQADLRPVTGRVGQTLAMSSDEHLVVNSYQVATYYSTERIYARRTRDVYLIVNVTVSIRSRDLSTWKATGSSGDRDFRAVDNLALPESGFKQTRDLVYELPADALAGFHVLLDSSTVVHAYENQLDIDLGIDDAAAARLAAQARGRYVALPGSVPEALP